MQEWVHLHIPLTEQYKAGCNQHTCGLFMESHWLERHWPMMRMVCQPRQDRSGTWCREPKMGRGRAGQTSEPKPLSAGIPRRPFPAFPHAKIWSSAENTSQTHSYLYILYILQAGERDKRGEDCVDRGAMLHMQFILNIVVLRAHL